MNRSFFDMTDKEKKEILNAAADESNKMQAELVKKAVRRDWAGVEPDGWVQFECDVCIACDEYLMQNKGNKLLSCFTSGCPRQGLYTAIGNFVDHELYPRKNKRGRRQK